ncbi:unnamed protein product [Acanthoscelides obtectus]|uniref:Uncharacterized protein n=1 Tax=Acanthoscelides obtectus TaxID=200917 RepID=A0A9P0LBM9_ACAOB|nr:unnamed protein product [Acanthoscelides obtectus]CAK1626108.1 hypothetical protein AOBTE_LOCUS3614 [Acanthoscelides obtectus]
MKCSWRCKSSRRYVRRQNLPSLVNRWRHISSRRRF